MEASPVVGTLQARATGDTGRVARGIFPTASGESSGGLAGPGGQGHVGHWDGWATWWPLRSPSTLCWPTSLWSLEQVTQLSTAPLIQRHVARSQSKLPTRHRWKDSFAKVHSPPCPGLDPLLYLNLGKAWIRFMQRVSILYFQVNQLKYNFYFKGQVQAGTFWKISPKFTLCWSETSFECIATEILREKLHRRPQSWKLTGAWWPGHGFFFASFDLKSFVRSFAKRWGMC